MTVESDVVAGMIQRKTMRIDPEVKAAAELAAAADHRSLSSLVEKLLADYSRERGFLKSEPRPVNI
jgi:hypothetical protein